MSSCYFCGKTVNDFNAIMPAINYQIFTSEELLNNSYKIGDYLSEQFKTDFATWTSSMSEGHTCLICQIYWNPVVEVLIKTINEQRKLMEVYGLLESELIKYI